MRHATSSGQPIEVPWRAWTVRMKFVASARESNVPVSSHAVPRGSTCTASSPRSMYIRLRSVISSSPRGEGVSERANSTARRS